MDLQKGQYARVYILNQNFIIKIKSIVLDDDMNGGYRIEFESPTSKYPGAIDYFDGCAISQIIGKPSFFIADLVEKDDWIEFYETSYVRMEGNPLLSGKVQQILGNNIFVNNCGRVKSNMKITEIVRPSIKLHWKDRGDY